MPIETAQYINTLQPDWPQGVDPEADGDDHIRMVKKVLQNTFPALDAPVNGTPGQINDLTTHVAFLPADAGTGLPERLSAINDDNTGYIPLIAGSMTADQMTNQANGALINWGVIMNILYPVGSVVMNSTGLNPANYMGFGTWAQRTGTIYGVGDSADSSGYNKTITPGAHNGDAYWRVQTGHLAQSQITVSLTMDPVPDHAHGVPVTHIETSSQQYGSISNGSYDAVGGYPQTQGAGGHTPTGTGSFNIGQGGLADGPQFMQPGYAFTVWERTA